LAIPVAVGALAVTLVLFQAQLTWQVERIDSATARDVDRATAALEERLRGHVERFGSLAAAWSRAGGGPQPTWEADVARFLRDQQVFLAVSHVEAGKLDWIFPSAPYPAHVGFDYSDDERRSAFLAAARERGGPLLTKSLPLKSGRAGVLLVAPLTRAVGDAESFVIAAALVDDLFRPTALAIPAHRLAVFEGDRLIYGSEAELGERTMRAREVRIGGMSLRLAATPLPETIESLRSSLPLAVFASGLLACVLLVVAAHLAQVSSRRAADLAVANASLKAVKEKLERLALFDELTALGNRNLLLMELDKRLEVARRDRLPLPLLLIDLNGFKAVNDTFGHQAGDEVLREFAARLMDSLPVSSEAFRTSGDEFAVLAEPGTSLDEAIIVAREIEDITRRPFVVGGEQRVIGASIGIATYPRHGEERLRLLRAADVAMYLAKHTATGIEIASDDAPTGVLRALKQSQLLR
jgi:diguanylate cyclase (GGDEF)-like protein